MAFLKLLALCAFMFASSFGVGLLPLCFTLPPRLMKLLTTAGVGLLIGVAFVVIIPEGIHTYYTQPRPHAAAQTIIVSTTPITGAMLESLRRTVNATLTITAHGHDHSHQGEKIEASHAHAEHDHARRLLTAPVSEADPHPHDHEHEHSDSDTALPPCARRSDRLYIGSALIAGFVLMLFVDRLSGGHEHSHGPVPATTPHAAPSAPFLSPHQHPAPNNALAAVNGGSVDSITLNPSLTLTPSHTSEALTPALTSASPPTTPALIALPPAVSNSAPGKLNRTALLGILTHSAIDGLALGAISVSEDTGLELVVFLAIVLHKGPAALGLAAFLLMKQRSKAEIRTHLMIFSAAAPVTAIVTYLLFLQSSIVATASGVVSADTDTAPSPATLGLCLIFSAGTFLFTIAAHILPEIGSGGSGKGADSGQWKNLLCLVLGCLAPLALNGSHHHH